MEHALPPTYDIYWPTLIGLAVTLTLVVITAKLHRMYIKRKEQR